MVIETVLVALVTAAKVSYAAFSKLADEVTKRRKTAKYEADKETAFNSALLGDNCDWALLEAVVEEADERHDVSLVANKLRQHVTFSPQRKGKGGKTKAGPKKATKKKPGPKKAMKKKSGAKKATKKKVAPKKARKKAAKAAGKKVAPKRKTAKRKAAKRKPAKRKASKKKASKKKAAKRK